MKKYIAILSTALFFGLVQTVVAQPANDHFANATLMTNYLATGSNVNATRQNGEPESVQHNSGRSQLGGRSVWWKWVAPDSRRYTVKTGDRSGIEPSSNFDTQLGVYTGTALANLVEVASNDDDILYENGLSSVEFDAVSGQTYHILVDGYTGQTGNIYLFVIPTRYTLSVTVNPPGAGTVSFDPTFQSNGYLAGTTVTLEATPTSGTNFYAWSGGASGRSNVVTFVMNSHKTIVANFFNAPEILPSEPQIIWRNTLGAISGWNMEGTNFISGSSLGSAPPVWRLASVFDFDSNGSGDFLFQHTDGRLSIWLMDGNARTNSLAPGRAGMTVIGAGDVNYNAQPDLIFQHGNLVRAWIMNGSTPSSSVTLGNSAPGWKAVAVADYNDDASADIFFQHTDGRLAVWLMNGTTRDTSLPLGKTNWRLAAVRDLNGDGTPDLILQNRGQSAAWLMDGGTNRLLGIYLRDGIAAPVNWNIVGAR
jgi:hypothetical protein